MGNLNLCDSVVSPVCQSVLTDYLDLNFSLCVVALGVITPLKKILGKRLNVSGEASQPIPSN